MGPDFLQGEAFFNPDGRGGNPSGPEIRDPAHRTRVLPKPCRQGGETDRIGDEDRKGHLGSAWVGDETVVELHRNPSGVGVYPRRRPAREKNALGSEAGSREERKESQPEGGEGTPAYSHTSLKRRMAFPPMTFPMSSSE